MPRLHTSQDQCRFRPAGLFGLFGVLRQVLFLVVLAQSFLLFAGFRRALPFLRVLLVLHFLLEVLVCGMDLKIALRVGSAPRILSAVTPEL